MQFVLQWQRAHQHLQELVILTFPVTGISLLIAPFPKKNITLNSINIPCKLEEEVPWCLWCTGYCFDTATHWNKRSIRLCNWNIVGKYEDPNSKKIVMCYGTKAPQAAQETVATCLRSPPDPKPTTRRLQVLPPTCPWSQVIAYLESSSFVGVERLDHIYKITSVVLLKGPNPLLFSALWPLLMAAAHLFFSFNYVFPVATQVAIFFCWFKQLLE